ncbi:MAG: hypothetical protein HYV09_07660 [Deltaproteobacteria bacterium]|nr:hypothetical protein [Deltaproteobacteria bacterium]
MEPAPVTHIARWDLDKTYLRTEFDTLRDLVKTALERADEKRSHPGASAVIRELQTAGVEIHVLSGSPEQMRGRLEAKLRLDGIRFASLTLKPNLENLLKLRFRSLRGQLGYKLPSLLKMRALVEPESREVLVGDDAEADAFIYALYADLAAGRVHADLLLALMQVDRCHPDEIADAMNAARRLEQGPAVERILIHLDQQTPPSDFDVYGSRLVPFYNYFQAALVLAEDGLLTNEGLLRVGTDLVLQHRFDGDALVRSYLELARRGHLHGRNLDALEGALDRWPIADSRRVPPSGLGTSRPLTSGLDEIHALGRRMAELRAAAATAPTRAPVRIPDYLSIVSQHNRRRR